MTHHDEALRVLEKADRDVSENWLYNTGERKADMIAQAQTHALLEIAEQLRVANLIALDDCYPRISVTALFTSSEDFEVETLRPDVARILGIGDDQ